MRKLIIPERPSLILPDRLLRPERAPLDLGESGKLIRPDGGGKVIVPERGANLDALVERARTGFFDPADPRWKV